LRRRHERGRPARRSKPDAVLAANILNGFLSKGGNPSLTAADAKELAAYMRTLAASQ